MFDITPEYFINFKAKKPTIIMLGQERCSICSKLKQDINNILDNYKINRFYCIYNDSLLDKYNELTEKEPLLLPKVFFYDDSGFIGQLDGSNLSGIEMVLKEVCEVR